MKRLVCGLLFVISTFASAQNDKYSIAKKLFDEKKYTEVVSLCSSEIKEIPAINPLFSKFLMLRVGSYTELRQFKLGVDDYLTLIRLNPDDIKNYAGLSYLYGSLNQFQDCLAVLKKSLIYDSKDIYIYNNLSYYSSQVEKYDDAINYANEGLKYVTDPLWKGNLLNNRGYGYIGLKKYPEALRDINDCIKLNPDNSYAYCYRAIVDIKLKKFENVCADLNKSKELGAINLTTDLIKQNCKN